MNYISLFSCAGIGCYGFKLEDFNCLATIELEKRRIEIQKYNNKCINDIGYINNDITKEETKELLSKAIETNLKLINEKTLDVIIATPPCQGMSCLNTKKNNEIKRNSLVLEAINIIENYNPKFFVIENVREFLNSLCTDKDNINKKINEVIDIHLSKDYLIEKKVINFKDYGSNSSRPRTLVIGVKKGLNINPIDLFPKEKKFKSLKDVIGNLKSLDKEEIQENDILHFSRKMNDNHYKWISKTKQGFSAFQNEEKEYVPHKIVDGKRVEFNSNVGNKFSRQNYDKYAHCIHTRSDLANSQYTIHPIDNRVYSIRELMLLQTIPSDFKWSKEAFIELNQLTLEDKKKWLKKNELLIRQVIGESVPTIIFQEIARNIKNLNKRK